jgi:multidrug efflux pump subunit AcrA (membrane-fusion protein)
LSVVTTLASPTLLTEIDVPNPDGAFSPGIYCTVELQIPRKVLSLVVPANAFIFVKGGLQVAVVEDGGCICTRSPWHAISAPRSKRRTG